LEACGPDDGDHLVDRDQLGGRLGGGLRLGLVVLDRELDLVLLAPDLEPARLHDVLEPHLGRELGGLPDLGDVTRHFGVDADADRVLLGHGGQGRDDQEQYGNDDTLFHAGLLWRLGLSLAITK